VDILAIERCDEGLVQLHDDGVGDFVTRVLDGLDVLYLLVNSRVAREHVTKGFCAPVNIFRLLGKEDEIAVFSWQETLQESRHEAYFPRMSRVKHHDDSRATEDTATILEMKTNALAGVGDLLSDDAGFCVAELPRLSSELDPVASLSHSDDVTRRGRIVLELSA